MTKSRPFSIYLLKAGFDATNALENDHDLLPAAGATSLPNNGTLYILAVERKPPWWRSFFGIQEELWQQFKGAILFLPAVARCFALTFGPVLHHMQDDAYESDFGLIRSEERRVGKECVSKWRSRGAPDH